MQGWRLLNFDDCKAQWFFRKLQFPWSKEWFHFLHLKCKTEPIENQLLLLWSKCIKVHWRSQVSSHSSQQVLAMAYLSQGLQYTKLRFLQIEYLGRLQLWYCTLGSKHLHSKFDFWNMNHPLQYFPKPKQLIPLRLIQIQRQSLEWKF